MRQRVLVIASLLALLAGSPAFGAPARAQSTTSAQLQAAAARAQEIFQYAAQGRFNAMYDLIHPDAHAVVPRATAVGAFAKIYAVTKAGQSQITGVESVDWTWAVNAKTYKGAAKVSFTQPYVDNGQQKQLSDAMYLVGVDGDWRWFFGSSRQFVDNAIKRYGGQRTTPLTDGDLLSNVVNDIDQFYRGAFKYTSFTYKSPGVVIVQQGDSVRTACGPADTGFWAFYCPGDQTVYLDEALLLKLQQDGQPFAAAFVIAHEWSHHIQTSVGIERVDPGQTPKGVNQVFSIELELMADCMAGAWALDVDSRGRLGDNDMAGTIDFALHYLGDPKGIDQYDPQAHGSADTRVRAINSGFRDGYVGCNIFV